MRRNQKLIDVIVFAFLIVVVLLFFKLFGIKL